MAEVMALTITTVQRELSHVQRGAEALTRTSSLHPSTSVVRRGIVHAYLQAHFIKEDSEALRVEGRAQITSLERGRAGGPFLLNR